MVISRFIVGRYPARVFSALNALMIMGYAILEIISGAKIISAMTPNVPVASTVTILPFGVLTVIIAVVSNKGLQLLMRWAWRPQILVICILFGSMVPRLAKDEAVTLLGRIEPSSFGRGLGFFGLTMSSIVTFSTIAADFSTHYPEDVSYCRTIIGTMGGLWTSSVSTTLVGIVLGSGCSVIPTWQIAFKSSHAALILEAYAPLGVLGKVCCGLLALGNLAGAGAGLYSQPLALRSVSRVFKRVRRTILTAIMGSIVPVCAIAGRRSMVPFLTKFVSIAGCGAIGWLSVFLLEHLVFRQHAYAWREYENTRNKPYGVAAGAAMLVGFAAGLLCMKQEWFAGPLARLLDLGEIDIGNLVGAPIAALTFLPLRYAERRLLGRTATV